MKLPSAVKLPPVPQELRQWPPTWPPAPFPVNKIKQDVPPHDERTARVVGRLLGWAFTICFVTGLISHIHQHPADWFALPSRPVELYRWTQGAHVIVGTAAIPLLFAKLWVVYPKLFTWPPITGVGHLLERLSVAVLITAGIFQVVTGLQNTAKYYPWGFGFTQTHYAVSWLAFGALLVHIGFMLPRGHRPRDTAGKPVAEPAPAVAGRRTVLAAGLGGAAVLTVTSAGQTITALRPLDVLGVRKPKASQTQGIPINRAAAEAQIATDQSDYTLTVKHGASQLTFTLAQLQAMPQTTVSLPISCVEGWSAEAQWTGVRVRDLLALVGAKQGTGAKVTSLESSGSYRTSDLNHWGAWDSKSLLALQLKGQPLTPDHGFPLRLISPNRPGVLQTKWVYLLETETTPTGST